MDLEKLQELLENVSHVVWGPAMLALFMGTGVYLSIRTGFLAWRNLPYALRMIVSRQSRDGAGEGDISPFSALTTALAATLGTGNIVGVATAMVLGGPGAIVWMCLSACFGMSTKLAECMLAVKYRTRNENGEMSGGPMYTMRDAFKNRAAAHVMGWFFALFAVLASFGIGNMTQANSISLALSEAFHISGHTTGFVLTVFILLVVVGGIQSISRVSQIVVPAMAVFYMIAALIVIIGNLKNVPSGLVEIFHMAFSKDAVSGGVGGTITASMMSAMRWGVARGVFSNEAGMGSAAITAAAARTEHPVKQGYINMTGPFIDTIVLCTLTGVLIASSGVLGMTDSSGKLLEGASLTIAAFSTVLGDFGGVLVSIAITLFAFATIIGWEYHGEKAFEYLVKNPEYCIFYRLVFSFVTYFGATMSMQIVWNFSDIANGLMAVPNLISVLALSGVVAREVREYQKVIKTKK